MSGWFCPGVKPACEPAWWLNYGCQFFDTDWCSPCAWVNDLTWAPVPMPCPQVLVGGTCCDTCASGGSCCAGGEVHADEGDVGQIMVEKTEWDESYDRALRARGLSRSGNYVPGLLSQGHVGGTADVLKGRMAHLTSGIKAHDHVVKTAFQQREVDVATGKGVQPGTIGTDYVVPWNEWMSGWYAFAAANVPDFWSDDEKITAQVKGYEGELVGWIQKFKTDSGTTVPVTPFEPPPDAPPNPGFFDPVPGGKTGLDSLANLLGVLPWLVGGGVALYLLVPVLPSLSGALQGAVKSLPGAK